MWSAGRHCSRVAGLSLRQAPAAARGVAVAVGRRSDLALRTHVSLMSTHANGKNGGFFGGLFGGRKKETEEGPGASEAVQEPAGVTDELKAIER